MASKSYPMCLTTDECLDHMMVTCSTAKMVGSLLKCWVDWWPTDEDTVQGMWEKIRSRRGDHTCKEVRKVIASAFFWNIWSQRNGLAFNTGCKKEKEIFIDIQFVAFDWIRCRSKGGKFLCWDSWRCNPVNVVSSCNALASR